jgi:hypothetical protein
VLKRAPSLSKVLPLRHKKEKRKEKERGVWGVPPHSQACFASLSDDTTKEDAEIASIHDGTSRVGKGRSRGAYTDKVELHEVVVRAFSTATTSDAAEEV